MKTLYLAVLFLFIAIHGFAQIIDGYTDKLSYRKNEIVTFNTYSSGSTFDLYDLNYNLIGVSISGFSTNNQNGLPTSTGYIDGYNYAPTNNWTVPDNATLPSGYYLLDNSVPIIIKDEHYPSTAAIVVVCPTNTVNAYTGWQSQSLYSLTPLNTTVSFHRPQTVSNLFCDAFLDWVSSLGYTMNFISDQDMDDYNEIKNAKMLIVPGHSEYWTRQARLNFDKFVDGDPATNTHGKDALILSGNSMWCQVRYEDENSPYLTDLSKLTCYRGANWCTPPNISGSCYIMDVTTDPLLATYPFMSTDLKYSVLGSIGCDWLRGGQCNSPNTTAHLIYNGHKILISNSPLLTGVTLPTENSNTIQYIPIYEPACGNEFDGTLVETDPNGNAWDANHSIITIPSSPNFPTQDPVLDLSALGFYQAEMVGYEYGYPDDIPGEHYQFNDPNTNNNQLHTFPFLVFKKTYFSGTVVNVSTSRWCTNDDGDWSSTYYRRDITANAINKMISDYDSQTYGQPLFASTSNYNPGPGKIEINPAYTSVCYSACTDGSISFTPQGIYLNNAYKVDAGFVSNPDHTYNANPPTWLIQTRYIDDTYNSSNNTYHHLNTAYIDPNCTTYIDLRIANQGGDTKPTSSVKPITAVSLFPNPTTGAFTININDKDNGIYSLLVTDISGRVIEQKTNLVNGNNQVDNTNLSAGFYLWQVYSENNIIGKGKVSIIKQN